MESVTPSQAWGVTSGTAGATVAVKNGWLFHSDTPSGTGLSTRLAGFTATGVITRLPFLAKLHPVEGYGHGTIEGVSQRVFANLG